MKRAAFVVSLLSIVGLNSVGLGGWNITSPIGNPTINTLDLLYVTANGTGTPGGLWRCRAYCPKEGGGFNMGDICTGSYNPGYPPPQSASQGTSLIDPYASGNGGHKIGTIMVTWQSFDYAAQTYVSVDYEYVTVQP